MIWIIIYRSSYIALWLWKSIWIHIIKYLILGIPSHNKWFWRYCSATIFLFYWLNRPFHINFLIFGIHIFILSLAIMSIQIKWLICFFLMSLQILNWIIKEILLFNFVVAVCCYYIFWVKIHINLSARLLLKRNFDLSWCSWSIILHEKFILHKLIALIIFIHLLLFP